jgi:chromosome segregation ATPase
VLFGWLEGLVRRNRLFFERIESNVGYLARRDARIKALDERVATARARSAQLEGQLKESNQKVIDLRRKLWDYERRHRSLLSIIGLYLSGKAGQLRKAWTLVFRRGDEGSSR